MENSIAKKVVLTTDFINKLETFKYNVPYRTSYGFPQVLEYDGTHTIHNLENYIEHKISEELCNFKRQFIEELQICLRTQYDNEVFDDVFMKFMD